jgi:RNAse (barnase) inhibitor barstar
MPIVESVRLIASLALKELFVSVYDAFFDAATVSVSAPVNVPLPVQPLTVKLWLLPVSVRLAIPIVESVRLMESLELKELFVSVYDALLDAATVSVAAPVNVPVPVQPLTVKLLLLPVSVRLAIPIVESVRLIVSLELKELFVSVYEALFDAVTVSVTAPVSVPVPVHPLTVKLWLLPVSVRFALPIVESVRLIASLELNELFVSV